VWPLNVVIKTGIFAINLEGKSYMTRPLRRIIDGSVIAFVLVLALSVVPVRAQRVDDLTLACNA
jgi:hypothetical protein